MAHDLWTEHLLEKHEAMTYSATESRELVVDHDGIQFRCLVPRWLPDLDLCHASASGELLFVIGRMRGRPGWSPDAGVVLVARRREDGSYATHLWHETYAHALRALGLESPPAP